MILLHPRGTPISGALLVLSILIWAGYGSTFHSPFTRIRKADAHKLNLEEVKIAPDAVPAEAIAMGRYGHALSGLMCLLLVFVLAYRLGGVSAAVLSGVLTLSSSVFVHVVTRIMTDGPFNFCMLLLTVLIVRRNESDPKSEGRLNGWLEGLLVGIAFNIKATALILSLVILFAVTLFRIKQSPRQSVGEIFRYGRICFFALFSCILFNPYLWPTASPPPGGGDPLVLMPARFSNREVDQSTLQGKAPVWLRLPELHLRWNRQIKAQASYHKREYDREVHVPQKIQRFLLDYNTPALLAAGILGLFAVFRMLRPTNKSRVPFRMHLDSWQNGKLHLLLIVTVIHLAWVVVLSPLDWDRYYLPGLLHLYVLEGVLLSATWKTLNQGSLKT